MEHTQYLIQKKKKKKRNRLILCLLLLAAAGICLFFWQKQRAQIQQADPNARESVELTENQSWRFLQIENIIGNEMQAVPDKDGEGKESETYEIPVGTNVITKLGSVTTFSRLASGDRIACLMEEADGKAVILKIWIEE